MSAEHRGGFRQIEGKQMQDEMVDSAVNSRGDLAGVFEYEDGVGYFYLYALKAKRARKYSKPFQ